MKEIIDATVTAAFCMSLVFGTKETFKFFRKETIKILHRGQNDISKFNRSLTKKQFDWEK